MRAKFIRCDAPLTLAWANNLRDKSICNDLPYLIFQSAEIPLDERLRRLTLCYIDFADPKGTFNYQKSRRVLIVGSKPEDVIEPALKTETQPLPKPVETADDCVDSSTCAAAVLFTEAAPVFNAIYVSDLRSYSTGAAPGLEIAAAHANAERRVVFSLTCTSTLK